MPSRPPIRDPQSVKMCNCAGQNCGVGMLGESEAVWRSSLTSRQLEQWHRATGKDLPFCVAGRIDGRPYCIACLRWLQAVKRMEDEKAAEEAVWDDISAEQAA